MQSCAVDMGEISIRVIKKSREVGSSQNNGPNSIATEERVSKRGQVPMLLFAAFPGSSQLDVGIVNIVHLFWHGAYDFEISQLPKERRLHHKASAKRWLRAAPIVPQDPGARGRRLTRPAGTRSRSVRA